MTRIRRQRRKPDELPADPRLPAAVQAALERGDKRPTPIRAWAWAVHGVGGKAGMRAAAAVLDRPCMTVDELDVGTGAHVRVSLVRWGKRDRLDLRTWFLGRDGRWRPTRCGVSVLPEQLEQLEAAVRRAREAHAAGALGPSPGEKAHA